MKKARLRALTQRMLLLRKIPLQVEMKKARLRALTHATAV